MSFRRLATRPATTICLLAILARAAQADEAGSFPPAQDQLPTSAPADAVVLFDGTGTDAFVNMSGGPIDWPVVEGTLVSTRGNTRSNHIVSKLHFRDADVHVEFMLPPEGKGNSGVYLHGHYELQIYNSLGKENPSMGDMGAVYAFSKPMVNATRPPGQWQVYDIRYRAPRYGADGRIAEPGSVTAWLNGQKVQEDVKLDGPRSQYHPFRYGNTPYLDRIGEKIKQTSTGPLFLQDHDNPVRFRNVWIRPLDEKASLYEPDAS